MSGNLLKPIKNYYIKTSGVKLLPRSGLFIGKIAEYAAKVASGFVPPEEFNTPVLSRPIVEAIRLIGTHLAVPDGDGHYRCTVCGRNGFTKRGLYLHLVRVHRDYIMDAVFQESERIKRFRRAEIRRHYMPRR